MGVVAVAIIAGMIWLMMRIDRASSQRIERRREAWRAGGVRRAGAGRVQRRHQRHQRRHQRHQRRLRRRRLRRRRQQLNEPERHRVSASPRYLTHRAVTRLSTVAGRLLSGRGQSGVAFAVSAQARGCVLCRLSRRLFFSLLSRSPR